MTDTDSVRWGILSTAKIGRTKVIPALQRSEYGTVAGIASRGLDRAQSAADQLGLPNAYGSYEDLLADDAIDAVYNPLPNHLHVPWSIKALDAGKHVLCEKPIGLDASEAEQLQDAARRHPNLKMMEAFMYRFHPQWQRVKTLVEDGEIGELRTVQSFYAYYNADPDNVRNKPEMGGGGLMDIGCYEISTARFLFGAEPQRVFGQMEIDPRFDVDRLTSGILDFGAGSATFTCSTQMEDSQSVRIHGTGGRIEIEIPFNAPPDQPCRLWLTRDGETQEITTDVCDQYTAQGDAFARAILDDAPAPTPLTDAVANMRVIDALRQSASGETWVAP